MAFEAFLTQGKTGPRKARWLTGSASLTLHGLMVAAMLVYSFWQVDELSPPTVTVTFLAPSPPPPPPPAARKRVKPDRPKPVVAQEIVQPKAGQILQPKEREEPEEEPDEGVDYGAPGGAGPVPVQQVDSSPKMLSPAVGQEQILTDPATDPRYRVPIPATLNRAGVVMFAVVKICVNRQGAVNDVKITKSMDPSVDQAMKQKIMTWKYKPFTVDGRPVPFCYSLRYEHRAM